MTARLNAHGVARASNEGRCFPPWRAYGPEGDQLSAETSRSTPSRRAVAGGWQRGRGQEDSGQWSEVRDQKNRRQGSGCRGQTSGDAEGRGAVDPGDRVLDPEDLAQRFTSQHIRGIGKGTREFVRNYKDLGKPWHEAGVPSAGNGTAMRAAPVGLVHLGDLHRIYRKKAPDTFWLVSDGFCERRISLLGRYTSGGATRMSTRSTNHTGCPDGVDGFRSHPPDGPTAKNWNRPFGKSTG